jgi:hypothetical protein
MRNMMESWPFVLTFLGDDRLGHNLKREPAFVRVAQDRRADLERLAGYHRTAINTMA